MTIKVDRKTKKLGIQDEKMTNDNMEVVIDSINKSWVRKEHGGFEIDGNLFLAKLIERLRGGDKCD